MTITHQIKILDKKILQNEVQYDLDKKTAIISARSSKNLDKVEYLTGEDLGLRPDNIEQVKFEYSPLGKIFNKLDFIFKTFGSNFNSAWKKILINLAKDEKNIDYNNWFFEINDELISKDIDFLEGIGTLYDLLIYLLGDSMRILTSAEDQIKFFKTITVLKKLSQA